MFEERRGRKVSTIQQGSQERERIWERSRSPAGDACVMGCFVRQGQLITRDVDVFLNPKKG